MRQLAKDSQDREEAELLKDKNGKSMWTGRDGRWYIGTDGGAPKPETLCPTCGTPAAVHRAIPGYYALACPLVENEQQRQYFINMVENEQQWQYFINMVKNAPKVPDVNKPPYAPWPPLSRKSGRSSDPVVDEAFRILETAREARERIERERELGRFTQEEAQNLARMASALRSSPRLGDALRAKPPKPPSRAADDLPLVTAGERKYLTDEE